MKLGFIVEGHHDTDKLKKVFPNSETVVTHGTRFTEKTRMDISKLQENVDLILVATDPDPSGDLLYEYISKEYDFPRIPFNPDECRCVRNHHHKIGIEHASNEYVKKSVDTFLLNLFSKETNHMTVFNGTKECRIVELLQNAGYEAYFVGGCIRDYVIAGRQSEFKFEDIDIATSASPKEAKEALSSHFANFNLVGARFGVLLVDDVEIAQFRSEVYADDSKAKPEVTPANSVKDDAIRRDFTMNALYMDLDGSILDFSNGIEDIEAKIIRAIGSASERFYEDPSRILRMFYLAARFNFEISTETLQAAQNERHLISKIPNALVGKITKKVISHNVLSDYLLKLEKAGLLAVVYPEFEHTLNKPQNPKYHDSDVFHHTIRVIKAAEKKFPSDFLMTMKAWCHDIAKGLDGVRSVNPEGQPNDINHEEVGFDLAKKFCKRLEFGREVANEVGFAVRWHGIRFEPHFKKRSYIKIVRKIAADCSSKEVLISRCNELIDFMYLDLQGFSKELQEKLTADLAIVLPVFLETVKETMLYTSELPIHGKDVIDLMSPSDNRANIGKILEAVLLEIPSSKEEALQIATRHIKKNR